MGDGKEKNSDGFDLKKELSTLVSQNILPSRIADKLDKKLEEKKIEINKEQLYAIANEIRKVASNYINFEKTDIKNKSEITQKNIKRTDENMQNLIEKIEKLKNRIVNIENTEFQYPKSITANDNQKSEKITPLDQELETKPLTKMPSDPEKIIVLIKWLQYLVDKCGHSHLSDILDYYIDIGWISEDLKINLIDYSHGITEVGKKDGVAEKKLSNMQSRDHIQSLLFIEKLRGKKIDKHFLDRIDDNISRITKKLEDFQLK
jgi:flagellar protein FlaD